MNKYFFWTAFLCETASILPYRILSYYPFRRQLRFPWQAIALVVGGTQILQSLLYAWYAAQGKPVRWIEGSIGLTCLVIFFNCIRADRWKVLFLYIFNVDYMMIVRGIAFFAEARLFREVRLVSDPLWSTGISLAVFAVTVPFMLWFLRRTKDRVFQTETPQFWRSIWLLPAFTTCIVLMFTWDLSADNVRQMRFLAARVLLIIAMFLVYYVLLQALDGIREAAAAKERARQLDQLLAIQHTQYEQISRHMEEVRRARHDLGQHLKVLHGLVQDGNRNAMQQYIQDYENSLSRDTLKSYCDNEAVSTIVSYYVDQAETDDVDLFVRLCFPKKLPVNEAEFCSLLGNLFANALDACRQVHGSRPFITINGEEEKGRILLTVDNSCDQKPVLKDGRFLSTKHEGFGTGTVSVKAVAERYHGWADFKYADGVFYASVLLYGNTPANFEGHQ